MTSCEKIVSTTKQWLSDFVIELNLCPFAKREYVTNSIRYTVVESDREIELLNTLHDEITYLIANQEVSTTLLIHPKLLIEFDDYNQFLDLADNLLEQQNWDGEFQIASFHPDYRFAGTADDDAENFTNRSPYPMLHILRENLVEKAVEAYPDIETIPTNNIELMTKLGSKELQTKLRGLF